MMLIKEILVERSRASLYHFTKLESALNILNKNILHSSFNHDIPHTVSFTRNPNYNIVDQHHSKYHHGYLYPSIRFELNQDKLRTKYKILPHRWQGSKTEKLEFDESEETISGHIYDFNDYLIEISIPEIKTYYEFLDSFAKYVIEYDNLNKYKYDKSFSKTKRVSDNRHEIENRDILYNTLVNISKLIKHPKMNKKDAKMLKRIIEPYKKMYI